MGWCAAFGCQNNSRKNKDKCFFLMPENKTTKNAWIKAANRTTKKSLKKYIQSTSINSTSDNSNFR